MEDELCKYAIDVSNYFNKALKCKISDDYCAKCRYCKVKKKMVMNSDYISNKCKVENEFENSQKGGI